MVLPPAATCVAFALPGSATFCGEDLLTVVPSQSSERPLLPHTHALPSARTAALCHVPAANDTTSVISSTGPKALAVLPLPSCPSRARPNAKSRPSFVCTSAWYAPARTAATLPWSSGYGTGVKARVPPLTAGH